ncbi:unnamed protein product [Closterium sp. NIES-53]
MPPGCVRREAKEDTGNGTGGQLGRRVNVARSAPLTKFVENEGRWSPDSKPDGAAGHGRIVEECARAGVPEGPPTPSVPLTKLLDRRGLTGAQLLLTLAATKASTLRGCTSTSITATATSTTAAAASTTSATAATTSTAATDAPTPSTTSTATSSASSTSATASPAAPSTTLAPLAPAVATSPTRGRRSSDLLSANEVDSSSRSHRGEKGNRGTPLNEGGATVAARSTYS